MKSIVELALVLGLVAFLASLCTGGAETTRSGASLTSQDTPEARRAYAMSACRGIIGGRLLAPTTAEWGPTVFRQDSATGAFVLRSSATAQNAAGVPVTHDFVCMVDPATGRGNAYTRRADPEMFSEVVRLFNLVE